MMDNEIRHSGLAGNFCAIVLELDGIPDASEISNKCRQFGNRFPLSTARLRPLGRRFAWQTDNGESIPFHHHNLDQQPADESELIHDILNRSQPLELAVPLEIHLICWKNTSRLVLRWFHPLCDAKGAELILYHLFTDHQADDAQGVSIISQLSHKWSVWQKCKMGIKSKKHIDELDCLTSVVPCTKPGQPDRIGLKVEKFNHQDSVRSLQLAQQYAGLSGISLYFIGCMMRAVERSGNVQPGQAYCVPYALNLRKRKSLFPVFSNQVSFLFAQAHRNLLQSRESLFRHLREQHKTAVRRGLDHAMIPLMQAGSWLSLDRYGKIVRTSASGKERSSFWFSYTGDLEPAQTCIGNCPIVGMYQSSQITIPPSLGLLVNHFQGRLTLSYNYVNNQFEPDWIEYLAENFKQELLELVY